MKLVTAVEFFYLSSLWRLCDSQRSIFRYSQNWLGVSSPKEVADAATSAQ